MRLRHVLLLLIVLAAQIPVTGLGVWVREHMQRTGMQEVSEKHLMLARNLAATLERYHRDVVSAVSMAADHNLTASSSHGVSLLHSNLGLSAFCTVRLDTGWIHVAAGVNADRCSRLSDPTFIRTLDSHVTADHLTLITPVMATPYGDNRMFALHRHYGELVVAELDGRFFVTLAASVRFGRMGHAVVFDSNGSVLAHPKKEWVMAAQNIGALEPVRGALAGIDGVAGFHSPALNADMVAGYAPVGRTGWGVMVPQPRAEMELQTFSALRPVYGFLAAAFIVALAAAYLFAGRIAKPLEQLTAAARRAESVSQLHEVEDEPGRWAPAETRAIVTAFNGMVRSIHKSQARMRRLAYEDSLTGLLNRASFQMLANGALADVKARHSGATLFYFDIDDFKQINDLRGHAAGDAVLAALAQSISTLARDRFGADALVQADAGQDGGKPAAASREGVYFSRFGGDEFVLLATGLADEEEAAAFAEAMLLAVKTPIRVRAGAVTPSVSIGIAMTNAAALTSPDPLGALLHMADAALYHAKARGKGRHCLYAPEKGVRSIHDVRDEVAAAITAGQMVLHYQPKVDARSGEVHALEALVRWNHPERGLIMPADFISAIEDSDVVVQLGESVLRSAAADLRRLQAAGRRMQIAINIASRHFGKRGFTERMAFIAANCGIEPSSIILEITEEDALRPEDDAGDVITALKQAGFGVALDDYGRGYSNLQRLAQLHVDSIKIDRSLIAQVSGHDRTREIVAATVVMAEALKCRVVAEGIENAAQAALLRRLGCHELQGYFYARPMPLGDVAEWLAARERSAVGKLVDELNSAVGGKRRPRPTSQGPRREAR